ncbi:MAG: alkaline phosphatase family protein [bacterium]
MQTHKKQRPKKEKTLHVIRDSIQKKRKEWKGIDRGNGFIIIQIDGLPHQILIKALSEGYMPFMKNTLASGRFRLSRYHCGIPGSTPSAQSGIMYGDNEEIPGFRWLNKENDILVSFKNPMSASMIESGIASKRRGILKNGSSYVNLLSGGAARSVFTLSTFLTQDMQKRLSGLAIFSLFFLNIAPVLRMIVSTIVELVHELLEYLEVSLKGEIQKSEGFFPVVRIFSNVLFYEVATVGTVIDISQGRPSIYLTYNGYDEAAHQRGPETKYALKSLKVIDRGIKRVVRQAIKKKKGMRYDIYILSDHGQHPSIPFSYQYGESLESFIRSKVKEGRIIKYDAGGGQVKDYLMTAFSSTLRGFSDQNLFFMRRVFKQIASYIDKHIGLEEKQKKTLENISIVNSSTMSNLYFNVSKNRLDIEEIERIYPGLVGALVRHDGVGLVAGRSNGDVVLLSRKGRVFFRNGAKEVDGQDPLEDFHDSDAIEKEVYHQFGMTHAGDLVLYGAMKDDHVINFEEQMGGHGGIGGMQNTPFILYPEKIHFSFSEVKNSRELYPVFSGYQGPE